MTNEDLALAQRAVACPKWRWMPGMRFLLPPMTSGRIPDNMPIHAPRGALPDPTDPATLGCLEHLVVERYDSEVWVVPPRGGDDAWVVYRAIKASFMALELGRGPSKAAALVKALEAA